MTDIQTCGIVCPTDWVPLPLEPSDSVRHWAKSTAATVSERSRAAGHPLDERTLRRDLRERADDSRRRDPFYAFALYPDGFDTALALIEVDLIHPDATVPEITLEWLAEVFSADDFGPPEVTGTVLPVGPAVRIRQNLATKRNRRGAPGLLRETVTYGIRPDDTNFALMLLASWTVPGISEELETAVDEIAQTLTVGF
ncbi:hypothetical protein [Streptomyces sp. NPDC002328]|uniref:hypothetical protein n=1 Tax=Streptomyces sp. NPDC002328 TaxID=3364642 RepID=UPI0036781229